jgi:ribose/xylose/arabinose/galactoside ABC-type transport system permease subunit/ABC-type branched-subunit amino acid transport system ATPase component
VFSGIRRSAYLAPGDGSRRPGLALLCLALIAFFGLQYEDFASVSNGLTTAQNVASLAIASVGTTALLISRNVDLSIGAQYSLIGVLVALTGQQTDSAVLAIGAALLCGLALGTFNGILVRVLSISPIIVTLGALFLFQGLAFAISEGVSISGLPDSFVAIGRNDVGPVPIPVVVAGVIFLVGGAFILRTVAGLRLYAIGGDPTAARQSGVRVSRQVIATFALNGMLIGVVAALTTARLTSGSPQVGQGFELDVLTAVILGGVAFSGGAGHPLGVLAGVATIGVLTSGLVFAGLQSWFQQIAKGGVLLLALAADQYTVRRRARAARRGEPGAEDHSTARRPGSADVAVISRPRQPSTFDYEAPPVLSCEGLTKSYGGVRALLNGTLSVWPGEVVCVVGDNGAGKSTLIKILSGVVKPDSGSVEYRGEPVKFASPSEARAAGIETVYQDLALCPNLGVAHNLILGEEPRRRWLGVLPVRDDQKAQEYAKERLSQLRITVPDLAAPVRSLSGGQRQAVAIARALHEDIGLAILDEPIAALGVAQTRNVLSLVRRAADAGTPVVLVTHDVSTVHAVADRVVVLRLGEVIHTSGVSDLAESDLLHLMAGLESRSGNSRGAAVEQPSPASR